MQFLSMYLKDRIERLVFAGFSLFVGGVGGVVLIGIGVPALWAFADPSAAQGSAMLTMVTIPFGFLAGAIAGGKLLDRSRKKKDESSKQAG